MTALEVLTRARALIEQPENWWDGKPYDYPPPQQRHCAVTALHFVAGWDVAASGEAYKALENAVGPSIPLWNDNSTHAQVLAGFERAIASLRPTNISVFERICDEASKELV